jgi:hypothetical protein
MSLLAEDGYLNTPRLLLAQRRRQARQIYFKINNVEPRAKHSMPDKYKDEIQDQLLKQLISQRRRAFRGPLVLRTTLGTTDRNPTQAHHIAKNLLDLFGKPRRGLSTHRRALLYEDDYQVHALSVSCVHGQSSPYILGLAYPLKSLLEDLSLAVQSHDWHEDGRPGNTAFEQFDKDLDEIEELSRDEAALGQVLGPEAFGLHQRHLQQKAQEHLLAAASIPINQLAEMYNVSGSGGRLVLASMLRRTLEATPLRLVLSGLPQVHGDAESWRMEISQKVRDFQRRFGSILVPLLVPIALQVIIEPPASGGPGRLHDLDNVLRSHLISRITEILEPLSDIAFTIDPQINSDLSLSMPPVSTRTGISCYEAWRLPPSMDDPDGFVSVGIVSNMGGHRDVFRRIEDGVKDWTEGIKESTHLRGTLPR